MKTITAEELKALQSTHPDLVIVDTRLASDFECDRIKGAQNNCVFEIAFDQRMQEIAPDLTHPVCVYGADEHSHESIMAAEKLVRAGYQQVFDLQKGFESWKQQGFVVEGQGKSEAESFQVKEGGREVDIEESMLEWTGRNLANKHWGTLKIKSGRIHFQNNQLSGGEVVIDMNSVTDLNLEDGQVRTILEDHLKSHDFFDVEYHPEAMISLTKITPIFNGSVGAPNLNITGALTLKGVTHDIDFQATAGTNAEGKWIAQANLDFDRTKWNVIYGSGKFFRNLGMHLVNDLISVQLKIVA